MTPTITIACSVRNRDFILNQYLDHILTIDYPTQQIDIFFLLNDSNDKSESILRTFKEKYKNKYRKITIETYNRNVPEDKRTTEIRDKYIYDHLSVLKNYIITKVKTDKLLFIDSDILVPNSVINNLLNSEKDIVSGLIYNGYIVRPDKPYLFPNIMKLRGNESYEHIVNHYVKNASLNSVSNLMKVDLTGAVIMLDKSVYKKIRYGYHPQGEDAYFCKMAQTQGFEIWCDIGTFCTHVMKI